MNSSKIGISFLSLVLFACQANAAVFVVNNQLDVQDDNPGDGICRPVNAIGNTCTLRAAIMEANAAVGPHTIALPSGTYTLTRTGAGEENALTGDLDIHRDITIINGTNNPPIINGNYSDRVFDVRQGELILNNVQVSAGMTNSANHTRGGGIRVNFNTTLRLVQAIVSANVAGTGGGIYSEGAVYIDSSEFFHNVVSSANLAEVFALGAAILHRGSLLQITASTFHKNGVIPGGEPGQFLSTANVIHGQFSQFGNLIGGNINITNSTFFENTRGILSDQTPLNVINSTIAKNGLSGLSFTPDPDRLNQVQLIIVSSAIVGQLLNCNNLSAAAAYTNISNLSNASSDTRCGFIGGNDHQNIAYPFLDDMLEYGGFTPTLMPRVGSVVVDNVVTCFVTKDQRGVSRPKDGDLSGVGQCDIGAVEFDPDTDPVPSIDLFQNSFEG